MRKNYVVFGMALLLTGLFAGPALAEPTPEALHQTIRDYIANEEQSKGAFEILDERGVVLRRLELVRVHERVGKTGDYYYSCTDMKDVITGDLLDLAFHETAHLWERHHGEAFCRVGGMLRQSVRRWMSEREVVARIACARLM